MPLTKKGKKIKGAMQKEYGKKKGESVFYREQGHDQGRRSCTPEDADRLRESA
jgi:hypothetical protein